jgi:hypothetical protein
LDSVLNNKDNSTSGSYTGGASIKDYSSGVVSVATGDQFSFKLSIDSDDFEADSQTIELPLAAGDYTGLELARELENKINTVFGSDSLNPAGGPDKRKFGVVVKFSLDDTTGKGSFSILSGTTGEFSNVTIKDASTDFESFFGIAGDSDVEGSTDEVILGTGLESNKAILTGATFVGLGDRFTLNDSNKKFVVTVDDVVGKVELPTGVEYTRESFVTALENGINGLTNQGRPVKGVKVELVQDGNSFSLKFTTGSQGDSAYIKVSGSDSWGLEAGSSARGSTSKWVDPIDAQYGGGKGESFVDAD